MSVNQKNHASANTDKNCSPISDNNTACPLTKEQFCSLLRIFHNVDSEIEHLYKVTKGALNVRDSIDFYKVIDWLTDVMHDRTNAWIDYFVYELEFGDKWHIGRITDDTGADVPMQTPEQLYEILKENYSHFV